MKEWIAIVFYGIIEGLTEFLPISSTGHLLLIQQWLPRQSDTFNILIQCAAVIAILPVFPHRILQLLQIWKDPSGREYWLKLLMAFSITGAGGLLLDKIGFTLPETPLPVVLALFVGGLLFIMIEKMVKNHNPSSQISWANAFGVGIAQILAAVFPGLSRSGACIIWLLLVGVERKAATEFSFLIGVPTIMAAGLLKLIHQLSVPEELVRQGGHLLLGMGVSAGVSFIAGRWLINYLQDHTFVVFGWYRIILAIVVMLCLAF